MALVVCSASLLSNYSAYVNAQNVQLDPTQTYTTGNIVVNTPQGGPSSWVNGVYQNSLTCWKSGDPGYCGPNAIVGPGNNINFSYGSTYLYQQQAVATVLPNSGTGLVVSGYSFRFTAKNGNGWDDGRVDNFTALVRFWDATGGRGAENLLYGNAYNLTYKFNWSTFEYNETLPVSLSAASIGQVQYGFLGRDNNGWSGPYGPELNNISFRLKYRVDPCSVDPTSSPTCPGYVDAILKLTPKNITSNETLSPSPTTSTSTIATALSTVTSTPTTDIAAAVTAPATTQSVAAVSAPVVSSSTAATSVTPTATNPQPKVGEVTVSGSQAKTSMSTSQILSIVRSEQSRIGSLETSTAQQAVEQAQAASDKAQQESVSISMTTLSQSQSASQSVANMFATNPSQTANNNASSATNNTSSLTSNLTPNPNRAGAIDVLKQPEVNTTTTQTTTNKPVEVKVYEPPQTVAETPPSRPQSIYNLTTPTIIAAPSITATTNQPLFTLPRIDTSKMEDDNQPKNESLRLTGFNPLLTAINGTQVAQAQTNEAQKESTVSANVQNNDLAKGGADISSMAVSPAGFNVYTTLALRDGEMYKPYEVYKNQVNVDNARALRQLSSDRLHNQMVDQQYNRRD